MSSSDPLGIFGGTFDPIHYGHLRLAEEAAESLGLAQVLCIPAGAPLLRDTPRTAARHRLAMVRLALRDAPRLALDAAEVANPAPSYTVDTLRRLRAVHGAARPLVLLLGADAFARLEAWKEWRTLFELAHLAVATRPGHDAKLGAGETGPSAALGVEWRARRAEAGALTAAPAGAIVPFAITALDISATAIRARLAAGRSVRYLLPAPVLDYIEQHHLYR